MISSRINVAEMRLCLRVNLQPGNRRGLGDVAGKVWRIGLVGYSCNEANVNKWLAALGEVLA